MAGLFDGLSHGRPMYPLYLADSFKPQEPTALGMLVESGMGTTGTKKETGTEKEGKDEVDAMAGQTSAYYDLDTFTKSLKNTALSKFKTGWSNQGEKYLQSDEFKNEIQPAMLKISQNEQQLKKNKVTGKTNLEGYKTSVDDIKESAKTFAQDEEYNLVSGIDANGNLIPTNDINKALTRQDLLKEINDKLTTNKEGLNITPSFPTGLKQDKFNNKLEKHVAAAATTETNKWTSGPKTSIVDNQGNELKGIFTTGTGESISNVRKLGNVTWDTFKGTLTHEENEAAHNMYYEALKDKDFYAYEVKLDATGKPIGFKVDKDGKPIPLSFDDYMADVVTRRKIGIDIHGGGITEQYHKLSGADLAAAKKAADKQSWYTQAHEGTFEGSDMQLDLGNTLTQTIGKYSPAQINNELSKYGFTSEQIKTIQGFKTYLASNPKATPADYIKDSKTSPTDAKNLLNMVNNLKYNELKTDKGKPWWRENVLYNSGDVNMFGGGVDNKETFEAKADGNTLIQMLMGTNMTLAATTDGKFQPIPESRKRGSSYDTGTKINGQEKMIGWGNTINNIETDAEGRSPVILDASFNIAIPNIDQDPNKKSEGSRKTLNVVDVVMTKAQFDALHGTIPGQEDGQTYSYSDEKMKPLVDKYVKHGDLSKVVTGTYVDAKGETHNKYEAFSKYKPSDEVYIVPMMMSAKYFKNDNLKNRSGENLETPTSTIDEDENVSNE